MLRLRHTFLLAREIGSYARHHRAWWILLVAPLVALGVFISASAHVVVPYTVYTLF